MNIVETTVAPAAYPVTRSEVLNYLRIEDDADLPVAEETLIDNLIVSATNAVEGYLRRALITRTLCLHLDDQPWVINLPMPPLRAVSSVVTVSEDGTETLEDASKYIVMPGDQVRVALKSSSVWGSTTRELDVMRVTYTAGYGDTGSAVPADIRNAILQQVGYLHANREASADLNPVAAGMVHRYRVYRHE